MHATQDPRSLLTCGSDGWPKRTGARHRAPVRPGTRQQPWASLVLREGRSRNAAIGSMSWVAAEDAADEIGVNVRPQAAVVPAWPDVRSWH